MQCGNVQNSVLPSRVLDVSSDPVRLHVSQNQVERYVCLSHCWGSSTIFSTTLGNYKDNQKSIPWSLLPKTFRDAIDYTRRLGYRYLWIDSLCIIQDDNDDWETQAAHMASIYQLAIVTLSAMRAANSAAGCYSTLGPTHQARRLDLDHKLLAKGRVGLYVREHIRHPVHGSDYHGKLTRFPLETRAWAYQERLLSPRVIYFTDGEIIWDCNGRSSCECSSPYYTNTALHKAKPLVIGGDLSGRHSSERSRRWSLIVNTFSSLDLTYEKDIFPALAGLAKQELGYRPQDRYLAGLWMDSFCIGLTWYVSELELREIPRRPKQWRAPSWSWASVVGRVEFALGQSENSCDDDRILCARLLRASVAPSGPDAMGQLRTAYVIVQAPLVRVDRIAHELSRKNYYYSEVSVANCTVEVCIDAPGEFMVESDFWCMRITKGVHFSDCGLVLRESTKSPGSYKRIGLTFCKPREMDEMFRNSVEPKELRII
jgi:hypothetical protein